jgi:VanZ family protein
MSKKLRRWLPPLIWMGIIFYFSSYPKVSIAENSLYAFVFFKTLHLIEYGILFFLLFRALNSFDEEKLSLKYMFAFTFLIAILYALSDEIHQTFVPTREGRLRDVFIDTAGMLLMYIYIRHNVGRLKKYIL